jgi:hypothetical protein
MASVFWPCLFSMDTTTIHCTVHKQPDDELTDCTNPILLAQAPKVSSCPAPLLRSMSIGKTKP